MHVATYGAGSCELLAAVVPLTGSSCSLLSRVFFSLRLLCTAACLPLALSAGDPGGAQREKAGNRSDSRKDFCARWAERARGKCQAQPRVW